jgi:hypothetical protein
MFRNSSKFRSSRARQFAHTVVIISAKRKQQKPSSNYAIAGERP